MTTFHENLRKILNYANVILLIAIAAYVWADRDKEHQHSQIHYQPARPVFIEQQQITDLSAWDAVITVHGYSDNREIAKKIVDYLRLSTAAVYRSTSKND